LSGRHAPTPCFEISIKKTISFRSTRIRSPSSTLLSMTCRNIPGGVWYIPRCEEVTTTKGLYDQVRVDIGLPEPNRLMWSIRLKHARAVNKTSSQPVTKQTHHKQTATGKVITQWLNRQVHPSEASIDVCDETRSLETRSSSIDRPQVQCLLFC
jgi:hypothetical protein